jgi:hypothetical protein
MIRRVKTPLFNINTVKPVPMAKKGLTCELCGVLNIVECDGRDLLRVDLNLNLLLRPKEGTHLICKTCFDEITLKRDRITKEDIPLYVNDGNIFIKHYINYLLRGYDDSETT